MTTNNTLANRGILSAANSAGWGAKNNRWQYPIFDLDGSVIGTRTKAMDRDSKFKYLWLPSKPDHPLSDWYILPNTTKAIKNADGVVYIANGEVSCLTHHTAQVYNTIATTLSEVSVPANIVSLFNQIGILRVVFLADNDDAGQLAAVRWRDALAGTGIHYSAQGWGEGKKRGYDSNDAWIDCGFNIGLFRQTLENIPALSLPKPKPKTVYEYDETKFDSTPQGLIDAIASTLHVKGFRSTGWSHNVSSPFHEDKKPSFGMRQDTGVGKDFATDESYSPIQIAEAIGIDWKRYYPEHPKRDPKDIIDLAYHQKIQAEINQKKALQAAKNACTLSDSQLLPGHFATTSWINQDYLPHSWVQDCLGLAKSNSAVVPVLIHLHHAFRTGQLNSQCFTRADVDKVIGKRRQSTVAALETLRIWGFVRFLHVSINTGSSDTNPTKPNYGGRPTEYCYQIETKEADTMAALISDMVKRKITEMVGKNSFVPRSMTLASDLGLSHEDFKAWQKRTDAATDTHAKYLIDMWVEKRREALWDYTPLVLEPFENAKDIRIQILHQLLDDNVNGIQLSNFELSMMLGCSASNLSSIYKSAHIESIRQRVWVTVENMKQLNLDTEVKQAQRDNQGKVLAIRIKYHDPKFNEHGGKDVYTHLLYGESAWYSAMNQYKKQMVGLTIMVEQPSLIKRMVACQGFYFKLLWQFVVLELTRCEIAKQIELGVSDNHIDDDTQDNGAEITEDMPKVVKKRTQPQSAKTDRDWTKFDPDFMRKQIDIEAYMFTQAGLVPDDLTLIQSVKWIASHAEDNPIRSAVEFFEQDTGDSTLIDLARYLGGVRLEGVAAQPKRKIEIQNMADPEPIISAPKPDIDVTTWGDFNRTPRVSGNRFAHVLADKGA